MASIAANAEPTPARPLSLLEKVSFSFGDLSSSLAWNAVAAFALFFYTDVALLPAAAIGTLFFATRIFDAIFDIAIGVTVDRTKTRWGRARPYLLFGAVPFGALTVLTFVTPDASQDVKLIYAAVTYFLIGLFLSIASVPYSAMLPMMTRNLKDKLDLSAARSVGTSVGVIVVTALFMPAVALFGGGERGFFVTALIVGALATLLLLIAFANCRERFASDPPQPIPIGRSVATMFRNQAWVTVSLFTVLNFVRFGAILSLTPYFAINVLQQPWMISALLPTLSGTLLLGAFFAPPILRRLGMRRGCTYALLLALALYAALPFTQNAPWTFIGIYVAASLSLSITMTGIFAMAGDAVDYHEWRFNIRHEGLLNAGIMFAIKIGMALGGTAVAYGLAFAAYDPQNVAPAATQAMSLLYYGVPITAFILQLICIQFYPVDKVRAQIAADLEARR
jgi:sugar (glycoside-pentoside-hexuronide) transporter